MQKFISFKIFPETANIYNCNNMSVILILLPVLFSAKIIGGTGCNIH